MEKRVVIAWALAVACGACSFIVDPDMSELGSGGQNVCAGNADCDDSDACTDDRCVNEQCVHEPRDDDGDGMGREDCGGDDCNDADPDVNPSVLEVCDDGIDQDCDDRVDGDDPDCGPGPDNDTCATALGLPTSTPGRVVGDTRMRTDTTLASCARGRGLDAPDVYFYFDLGTPREVTIDTFSSDFDTVLEVREDCANPGSFIACSGDVNPARQSRIVLRTAPARELWVLLDGDTFASAGRYVFNYEVRPVRPQLGCDNAMDVTGGAAVYGETDFASFQDAYSGSCGGDGSAEEVFRMDMPSRGILAVSTGLSDFDTVLYVRRETCRDGTEMRCEDFPGGTEETRIDLAAGTYYIFVDGQGGLEGAYRMAVLTE